jgi:hypothetical protein
MRNLEIRFKAIETALTYQCLLEQDAIWTSYLEKTKEVAREDVEILNSLVDSMDKYLRRSVKAAEWLQEAVTDNPQELEQLYNLALIWGGYLTEGQKKKLSEKVDRHGGIVKLAITAMQGIIQKAPEERELLSAKMQLIKNGEFTQGDLRPETICNIGAGILVGSIFAANPFLFGFGAGLLIGGDC